MITAEPVTHICLDAQGVAWIDDTNVKVIDVAVDKLAHRCSAEEIREQYPRLTLSQVYAALAYYHDHRESFDAQIQKDLREVDALRETAGEPPKADQVRALKRRA